MKKTLNLTEENLPDKLGHDEEIIYSEPTCQKLFLKRHLFFFFSAVPCKTFPTRGGCDLSLRWPEKKRHCGDLMTVKPSVPLLSAVNGLLCCSVAEVRQRAAVASALAGEEWPLLFGRRSIQY